MREIADECPNVFVKIGGFATPVWAPGSRVREKPPGSAEVAEVSKLDAWHLPHAGRSRKRCCSRVTSSVD